ncbi:MAG: hypothetical protein QME96_18465, partial [Myxococcota bacterium]|nr:hypothetical protein [Myxococcota bacterium]
VYVMMRDGTLGRGSPGPAEAGARAVAALFRCLAETGILAVRDYESPADLGDRPPTDPAELAARLLSQTATVTSLEAALLVLRIARSEGLDARVVRVERWSGANVPADLSGTFGHYAVEIGPPRADGAAGTVVDPSLAAGIAGGPIDASPVADDVAAGILDAYRALRAALPREDAREPDRSAAKEHLDRARKAASKAAPVRLVHALTAGLEDPRTAFAEADALRESASHSEKIGLAELCIGLGRIPEAERLLAEVEAVYPVWYKVPLVRAQIALIRASVLAKSELALARPAALPEGMADEIGRQIRALGVPEGRRPDDLFDEAESAIGRAERLGGATLASRLRQVHAVALAEYKLASGDIAAARDMLDRAAGENPASLAIALPRAALALATGDE